MEPVVLLTRLEKPLQSSAVGAPSLSLHTSHSMKCHRFKGKKARFERRKKWYMKDRAERPLPSFKGWENVHTPNGFGEDEQNESYIQVIHGAIDNEDLVTYPTTKVTSISVHSSEIFTFTVVPTPCRRIRILSLCGGIETGRLITSKLGLDIAVYFSTEIDDSALKVQRHRFPGHIVALGCMKKLTHHSFLAALGRIDLILASPPCDQISLTNPCRKEFSDPNSTAFLTLDCVKIIKHLMKKMYEQKFPCFYLMEQTAHISRSVRAKITEAIGSDPHTICASYWTPMVRRRLYFTNLPGAAELETRAKSKFCGAKLQQHLDPFRKATVCYARTLTTNSANQGLPVWDGGVPVKLSLNECESLMGFPQNYTACGDLSIQARRKLLGKAWCCHVVQDLLRPLADIYRKCS